MMFHSPAWQKTSAGQGEIQSSLHIPTVYEAIPSTPMLWEYHVVSVDTREDALLDAAALNELGNQGWLLSNIWEQRLSSTGSRVYYHFVRQREAREGATA